MDINIYNQTGQSRYPRTAPYRAISDRKPDVLPVFRAPNLSDKILREEGKNEQTKNDAAKMEEDKRTVRDLIRKSNRCIQLFIPDGTKKYNNNALSKSATV